MKADLKVKYLQYLNQKKQDAGFTLIELLVVIIIIGILAAIALPSFLSQANKGKQSEAKTYLGSINKGQQAFYTEKSTFATNILDLGIGIRSQTTNYQYTSTLTGTGTSAIAVAYSITTVSAALKNYSGQVGLIPSGGGAGDITSVAILCEQKQAGAAASTSGTGSQCDSSTQIPVGGTQ